MTALTASITPPAVRLPPTGRAWRARARAMGWSAGQVRGIAAARRHGWPFIAWTDVGLLDRAL